MEVSVWLCVDHLLWSKHCQNQSSGTHTHTQRIGACQVVVFFVTSDGIKIFARSKVGEKFWLCHFSSNLNFFGNVYV